MDEAEIKLKISRLTIPLGVVLPLLVMTANLLYDEFWSLIHFVPLGIGQILTDLSLPNNHPLNTFALKVLSNISLAPVILRLASLVCGAFVPWFCGQLAYKFSRKNHLAAFISAAILAMLSYPLVIFSSVARGYILQLFFLLLCIYGMTLVKANPVKAAWLTAIGGIGTVLSVSNGALFLLPAGLGYLLLSGKKERCSRQMWYAAGAIALFCGIFYGVNFAALRSGQQWGREITGWGDFFTFLWNTSLFLVVVPSSLAAAGFFISRDFHRWIVAGLLFLPLLLAIFSNGGPERCYLYLSLAVSVTGGVFLAEFFARWKKLCYAGVPVALVLGAASFYLQQPKWKFVDYVAEFAGTSAVLPQHIYPVFRASSGFPIRCGADERELLTIDSRLDHRTLEKIVCLESENGIFNGLDGKQSESLLVTSCRGEAVQYGDLSGFIYCLQAVKRLEPGDVGIIIGDKIPQGLDNAGDVLYLNPWITLSEKVAVWSNGTPQALELPNCRLYRIVR